MSENTYTVKDAVIKLLKAMGSQDMPTEQQVSDFMAGKDDLSTFMSQAAGAYARAKNLLGADIDDKTKSAMTGAYKGAIKKLKSLFEEYGLDGASIKIADNATFEESAKSYFEQYDKLQKSKLQQKQPQDKDIEKIKEELERVQREYSKAQKEKDTLEKEHAQAVTEFTTYKTGIEHKNKEQKVKAFADDFFNSKPLKEYAKDQSYRSFLVQQATQGFDVVVTDKGEIDLYENQQYKGSLSNAIAKIIEPHLVTENLPTTKQGSNGSGNDKKSDFIANIVKTIPKQ